MVIFNMWGPYYFSLPVDVMQFILEIFLIHSEEKEYTFVEKIRQLRLI